MRDCNRTNSGANATELEPAILSRGLALLLADH